MTFTRKDYMAAPSPEAHRRYYAQFVTPAVLQLVRSRIGGKTIKQSTDPHFNDIPLSRWDALESSLRLLCLSCMGDINGPVSVNATGQRSISWSLGDAVCIAKEAARQIKDDHTTPA